MWRNWESPPSAACVVAVKHTPCDCSPYNLRTFLLWFHHAKNPDNHGCYFVDRQFPCQRRRLSEGFSLGVTAEFTLASTPKRLWRPSRVTRFERGFRIEFTACTRDSRHHPIPQPAPARPMPFQVL